MGGELANVKGFTVFEQHIKLGAIQCKLGFKVEYFFENALHHTDVFTNGNLATQLFL